jgi:hypothetical protein
MNIIETLAPLPIEDLKKYFEDNDTKYIINYSKSKLTGNKLLIYLSNLDVPCDIKLDTKSEEYYDLLKDYFNSSFLLQIETLELGAIQVILCKKKILSNERLEKFILENFNIVEKWESILDSCTLFNLFSINDDTFKEYVKSHKKAEDENLTGINFVNLFKHPDIYEYLSRIDPNKLFYYEKFFNDYIFKGKNLYSYWADPNNPLFLLTYSISAELFKPEEYIKAKQEKIFLSKDLSTYNETILHNT